MVKYFTAWYMGESSNLPICPDCWNGIHDHPGGPDDGDCKNVFINDGTRETRGQCCCLLKKGFCREGGLKEYRDKEWE